MSDGLHKQVVEPRQDVELVALKRRIAFLQVLYLILFVASLALIVYNSTSHAASSMHLLWAVALGAAVITRLVRQSMVNRYNARLVGGRPAPMT